MPSKTDESVAPEGHENLFILIPVATGLGNDNDAVRERYFNLVMDRLEKLTGEKIRDHIIYKKLMLTQTLLVTIMLLRVMLMA